MYKNYIYTWNKLFQNAQKIECFNEYIICDDSTFMDVVSHKFKIVITFGKERKWTEENIHCELQQSETLLKQ